MAKRLAVAYILFKLIAAFIALILFPVTTPLLARGVGAVNGVTLLAAYHTAYNVVGVVVLMPAVDWFTRLVERLLPEQGSPLTRGLDPSALVNPVVAVEAVRRTLALSIETLCELMIATLQGGSAARTGLSAAAVDDALRKAREFLSETSAPPDSTEEELRLISTLYALDHTSRFATIAREEVDLTSAKDDVEQARALELCIEAMRSAALAIADIAGERALSDAADPIKSLDTPSADAALAKAEQCAAMLRELRRAHRRATLSAVGTGTLNADEATARVDAVQRLEALARRAWRSAAHLHGRDEPNPTPTTAS
jgi:phosphate:Na+ symporter